MNKILKILLDNYNNNTSDIFRASEYWKEKNQSIIEEIKKKNIKDFRSNLSNLSSGFSDNNILDYRKEYGSSFLRKIIKNIMYCYPLNSIFRQQVELTKKYYSQLNFFKEFYFKSNLETRRLLNKYKFKNTTAFGSENNINFKKKISIHYLFMAQRFEKITQFSNLSNINSHCEIGGGFGAFLHFMLQNQKKMKKILYVDIFPQLYFGTLYLKKFFKHNVIDYFQFLKNNKTLFSNNNQLEIVVLPPNALNYVKFNFDSFHNAYSFQEMNANQIKYYRNFIKNNSDHKTLLSFIFYQNKNKNIINYKRFKTIFSNFKLKSFEYKRLDSLTKDMLLMNV